MIITDLLNIVTGGIIFVLVILANFYQFRVRRRFSGVIGKIMFWYSQELEKTYILSGPTNLTELSITLSTLLSSDKLKGKESQTILFLDSISTFLIYNDANVVARFLHTIAGRVRTHNIRGVFFSLHDDITKGAIASTVQFHDKVLRID